MRLVNSIAPSAKPTGMPFCAIEKIVCRKAASGMVASPREKRIKVANSCFSAMFQATITSTEAGAASGT